ncbi:MAG: hypothetical protein EBR82_25955 [Caulobacteraceae bacterium]|nr:hypothetical protein [Caulobacteraceae bacterium]
MDGYESDRFTVTVNGEEYTAYIFYHLDGGCSIEVEGDIDAPENVYDAAWVQAVNLGLLEAFGDNT